MKKTLISLLFSAAMLQSLEITAQENYSMPARYAPIGQLIGKISNSNYTISCAATKIADNLIITNASCIFDEKLNPLEQIEYFPGRFSEHDTEYSRTFVKNGWYLKGYKTNKLKEFKYSPGKTYEQTKGYRLNSSKEDIAILEIPHDQGKANAFSRLRYYDKDKPLTGLAIGTYAYPRDKSDNTDSTMWTEKCKILHRIKNLVSTSCDNYLGLQGSALIYSSEDYYNYVIGLTSNISNGRESVGVLFRNEDFNEINSLLKGKTNNLKNFQPIKFNTQDINYMNVDNDCNVPINFIYKQMDKNSKTKLSDIYTLKAGKQNISFKTHSKNFYFYAKSEDKKLTWKGNHKVKLEDITLGFRKIVNNQFGDNHFNLNCN